MDTLSASCSRRPNWCALGRLSAATPRSSPAKTELARLYIADTLRLRASQAQFRPDLRRKPCPSCPPATTNFRALLQINLTVLATAHAVSEGIVRGVSGELARKSAPQTYGASGRANAPDLRNAPPIAVSRVL